MVPDIEELGAKFEMHLLVNRKLFDEREIPVLQSRTANNVSPRISEGSKHGVGHEGAGVEQRSGKTVRAVRVPHHIRTRAVKYRSPAIGIRSVHQIVGGREPIACLRRNNPHDLPVSNNLILKAGRVPAELLIFTERQIVNVAEDEAVPNVKVGIPVFELRICLQTKIPLILRTQTGVRGVVERVTVCVGSLKLQAI